MKRICIDGDRFRAAYQSGKSDAEIGRVLGVGGSTIGRYRKRKGLPANNPGVWTGDEIAKLRKLASEGLTAGEIALKLGCKRNRVWAKAKSLAIDLKEEVRLKPYSAADDRAIMAGAILGIKQAETADKIGRKLYAVRQRLMQLRAEKPDEFKALHAELRPKVPVEVRKKVPRKPVSCVATPARHDPAPVLSKAQRLARLVDRFGESLIDDLSELARTSGFYRKLDSIAARHGVTAKRAQSIWHQVRAA